jgi:hypothetical protein
VTPHIYVMVQSDDGERLCWRLSEADINVEQSLIIETDEPLGEYDPSRPRHKLTLSGMADMKWRPSERSARLLREAFNADDDA